MAFNKRTWLGRQGTGLNKFSIGGATPVTIVNQPDSVTQVGDALSAGNLNDLEDRIEDAFDDVDTALDTKADEQDVTNLNNAISALQKQIDNITEAEDLLSDVDYKNGETAVPANVSEYAEVSVLKGVGRIANNLQYNGNFASADGWISGTVSDGHIEGSANAGSYWQPFNNINTPTIIQGHVYLVRAKLKAISGLASETTTYNLRINGQSSTNNAVSMLSTSIPNGTSVMLEGLHTANASTSGTGVRLYWGVHNDTNNFTAQWEGLVITDLTLYFNGSIPTNAQTLAQIQQNYPELLEPSEYNTGSVVFPTYSAVESVGKNLFDETTKFLANGFTFSGGYWSRAVLSGLFETGISYKPNTQYAFSYKGHCSVSNVNFRFIVAYTDGTSENTALITSTTDALYTWVSALGKTISSIRTSFGNGGSVYLEYLQIEEGSSATEYSPYMTDTLSLPEPVTLRSAGSVYEEYFTETGRVTHPIGEYTFTGNETWIGYSEYSKICTIPSLNAKEYGFSDPFSNLVTDIPLPPQSRVNVSSGVAGISVSGQIVVITDASLATAGKKIYFELATPAPDTYVDPLPDNYIKVEPNGTIETVQSQSPKVDGAMTVTYTNKVSA